MIIPQKISSNILEASSTIEQLAIMLENYRRGLVQCQVNPHDLDALDQLRKNLEQLNQKWHTIFSWQDGPLVQAMKDGHMFLVDEISLADDSVLERLNSVLEPERTIVSICFLFGSLLNAYSLGILFCSSATWLTM